MIKSPYNEKLIYQLLPKKYNSKYHIHPILYLYNENSGELLYAYSFDKYKKVIYVKDYETYKYRYMSLYEFTMECWKILTLDEIRKVLSSDDEYCPYPFEL